MPIKVRYLDNGIGVSLIGEGKIVGDDIIKANRKIFASAEKMKKYKYGLVDYSRITEIDVSASEVDKIAAQDKKASEFIPEAVLAIAAKKDLEFGLTRMWEIIVENSGLPWETMVFRDINKAEKWIKQKVKEKFDIDITMAQRKGEK